MLRDADPTRRRFAAIVLALDQYSDQDSLDSVQDRLIDLNFVIGRLRVTDCADFAASMKSPEYQGEGAERVPVEGYYSAARRAGVSADVSKTA